MSTIEYRVKVGVISLIAIKSSPNSLIFYTQCRCAIIAQDWPGVDLNPKSTRPISGLRFSHRDHGERHRGSASVPKFRGRYLQREFTGIAADRGKRVPPRAARDITFTRNARLLPRPLLIRVLRPPYSRRFGENETRGSKRRLRKHPGRPRRRLLDFCATRGKIAETHQRP